MTEVAEGADQGAGTESGPQKIDTVRQETRMDVTATLHGAGGGEGTATAAVDVIVAGRLPGQLRVQVHGAAAVRRAVIVRAALAIRGSDQGLTRKEIKAVVGETDTEGHGDHVQNHPTVVPLNAREGVIPRPEAVRGSGDGATQVPLQRHRGGVRGPAAVVAPGANPPTMTASRRRRRRAIVGSNVGVCRLTGRIREETRGSAGTQTNKAGGATALRHLYHPHLLPLVASLLMFRKMRNDPTPARRILRGSQTTAWCVNGIRMKMEQPPRS